MNAVVLEPTINTIDTHEFRRALGCFPTGVAVITTRTADGIPVGLTCNSFSSVSLDPPLVLWSLRTSSRSLSIFQQTKAFAINVLADHQRALSAHFASKTEEKFAEKDHAATGLPTVEGCIARFCCQTVAEYVAGDHVVFIGQVQEFNYCEQDPLVFYRGAYKIIGDSLQDLAGRGQASAEALNEARARIYGELLRMACDRATSEDLQGIENKLHEIDQYAQTGQMQARAQAALQFFYLVSAAAHNPVLEIVAQSLGNLMKQKVSAGACTLNWAELHQPALTPIRWRMLEALRSKAPEQALSALADYIRVSPIANWEPPVAP